MDYLSVRVACSLDNATVAAKRQNFFSRLNNVRMCPTEISLPNNQVGRKHLHIDVRGLQ